MDLEKIKDLMAAMEERKISKLALKEKSGFELELERDIEFQVDSFAKPKQPTERAPQPHKEKSQQLNAEETEEKTGPAETGYHITSPMVGTFYGKPSPDDPDFVKVGDVVDENTIVCIIEAMKVMNEVRAGKKGTIAEIFVDNAHPVEFGTKLFRLVER